MGRRDAVHITELDLIIRVLVGWGLTFVLGFERAVRGAPAGDRTFSLVGAGTSLIGTLSLSSPAVLGGAVTGIGFIGGGLCFRQAMQDKEILHGVTTAASIFGAAAIGAAAGVGHIWLAVISTAAVFISLEIRHLPLFRLLDARRWQPYFHHDDHTHFGLRGLERALMHEIGGEAATDMHLKSAASSQSTNSGSAAAERPEEPVATPAISQGVAQAIQTDIVADQMIEAAASAARGASAH
jgi:putative Mg2+ transporter-C (MgtC) family protein